MARLKPELIAELNCLHAQCKAAFEFLHEKGHLVVHRAEWESGIAEVFARQDLRGMRIALRDLHALARNVSPKVEAELDQAVTRAAGAGLFDRISREAAGARAIVRRGRIRNATEYHVIRSHLDQIEGKGATEEVQLKSLLARVEFPCATSSPPNMRLKLPGARK
jgi:hypothetical protein